MRTVNSCFLQCVFVLNCLHHTSYLPRGTIHAPYTEGESSIHLTIGIDGDFVWSDVLKGLWRTGGMVSGTGLDEYLKCLPNRLR